MWLVPIFFLPFTWGKCAENVVSLPCRTIIQMDLRALAVAMMLIAALPLEVKSQRISVPEPEFPEETLLLVSDSEGVKLTRENGSIKTKNFAINPKIYLSLDGPTSKSRVKGGSVTRLIIRASNNDTDPTMIIGIFRFDVKRNSRQYKLMRVSGWTGNEEFNNLATVYYDSWKYGESSYYLLLHDLEPGEYGIVIGDPYAERTALKITTFSVE